MTTTTTTTTMEDDDDLALLFKYGDSVLFPAEKSWSRVLVNKCLDEIEQLFLPHADDDATATASPDYHSPLFQSKRISTLEQSPHFQSAFKEIGDSTSSNTVSIGAFCVWYYCARVYNFKGGTTTTTTTEAAAAGKKKKKRKRIIITTTT